MNDLLSTEHASLLGTLQEYAEKLRNAARSFHERKSRLLVFGIAGSVATAMLTIVSGLAFSFARNLTEPTTISRTVTVAVAGTLAVVVTALVLFTIRSFSDRNQIAEFEIVPLQRSLRRLLVRASQLETHSVSDPDEKILFDLRLAEAESALALSDWVLSTRQSLFSLSGSQRMRAAREHRRRAELEKLEEEHRWMIERAMHEEEHRRMSESEEELRRARGE
jgi:signal transduction histidine kinase